MRTPDYVGNPDGRGARRPTSAHLDQGQSLVFGLGIAALVLGLIYGWFALGNRAIVFLYNHDMGPVVPDTRPFSPVTRSRYWMTGLVAGGAVMMLYAVAQTFIGALSPAHRPPTWWRVWAVAAVPIGVGIPAITMTVNSPRLPLGLAAQTTSVALGAVALALQPGTLAAHRPLDTLLLAIDGMALALWLTGLPGLEELPRWIASGRLVWIARLAADLASGLAGLIVAHVIRRVAHRAPPSLGQLVLAGLGCAYLGLPLLHHIFFTDGYYYISDMDNFFARTPWIQGVTWGLSFGLAWVARLWADRQTIRAS